MSIDYCTKKSLILRCNICYNCTSRLKLAPAPEIYTMTESKFQRINLKYFHPGVFQKESYKFESYWGQHICPDYQVRNCLAKIQLKNPFGEFYV